MLQYHDAHPDLKKADQPLNLTHWAHVLEATVAYLRGEEAELQIASLVHQEVETSSPLLMHAGATRLEQHLLGL